MTRGIESEPARDRQRAEWLAPALLLAAALPLLFGLRSETGAMNEHLEHGDEFYHAFHAERAIEEYEDALKEAPADYGTLLRLARTYSDLGRVRARGSAEAESLYRKSDEFASLLGKFYPDSAETHFLIALAKGSLVPYVGVREKIALGRMVRDHARAAIEHDSTFALAYVVLAAFERETAKLNWFEKGIARIVFGETLSGSLDTSKQLLRKALTIAPDNPYAYFELGWTFLAEGSKGEAVQSFERVTEIKPKDIRELQQEREAQHVLARLRGEENSTR